MAPFKNILVVTDNIYMLNAFRSLVIKFSDQTFTYAYSLKNPTPRLFDNVGCKPIEVIKECESIIEKHDLIFSLHCKQIFPRQLVESVTCINLHPGFNPYNRGWFPQVFSILNGLPAGATLHQMTEEVDRGPVIDQVQVEIEEWDTSLSAYLKIQDAEIKLLQKNIDDIINHTYLLTETEVGNYNGIKDYTALKKIDLNQSGTFKELITFLRAMSHPPYKNLYFITEKGEKVYISLDLTRDEQ